MYKPGGNSKKPANVPDHEPPNGYICYRCGNKGHWIQMCPTNDNPEYDNRPRVKRTTGIPKSFLKAVDKSAVLGQSGVDDDAKAPSGIMVNADGDFVIAEPDKAAWEQFQAKTKSSAAAQKVAAAADRALQERGLECPLDRKMFIDPMKTPCCQKTYCNDCITNALIESDFVCPACQTEGVLIDDLRLDDEATANIKEYIEEKESASKTAREEGPRSPAAKSPVAAAAAEANATPADAKPKEEQKTETATSKSPTPTAASVKSPAAETGEKAAPPTGPKEKEVTPAGNSADQGGNLKKRPAEDAAENPKIPKVPKAMQKAQEVQQQQQQQQMMQQMMNGMNGMPNMGNMPMMPGFGSMPMMPGFGGMGAMPTMPNMGMNLGMGMGGMMNPMMMNPMMGMPGFNNLNGGGFPLINGMDGNNNGGWNMNSDGAGNGLNGGNMNGGGGMNGFNLMKQPNFTQPGGGSGGGDDDDDAYFRKPVNPHRHQNRQRRVRPSDYREL